MLATMIATLRAAGVSASASSRFGEPALELKGLHSVLVVSLFGAQVLEWRPANGANALWLTDEALHNAGAPIRGGIPVCWPWFGAPYPPFSGPGHGPARRQVWQPVSAAVRDDEVFLHFRLEVSGAGYRLGADYRITAGRSLALELVTTNLGRGTCPATPAFHPYFALEDINRARLHLASSIRPRNRLSGESGHATDGVTFNDDEQEMEWTPWSDLVLEPSAGTRLEIRSNDATHCVAWNPGRQKTVAIADLHPDAFREFVCVEPARLDPDASMIPPGGNAELSMTLCCVNSD